MSTAYYAGRGSAREGVGPATATHTSIADPIEPTLKRNQNNMFYVLRKVCVKNSTQTDRHTHTHGHIARTNAHTHTIAGAQVRTKAFTNRKMSISVSIVVSIDMYIHIYIYIYTCQNTCICVYIPMYIHTCIYKDMSIVLCSCGLYKDQSM